MPFMKKIATLEVDGIPNKDYVNCNTSVFNYDGLCDYNIDCTVFLKPNEITELTLFVTDENFKVDEDILQKYIDEISMNTNINIKSYKSLIDFKRENKKIEKTLNSAIDEMNTLLGIPPKQSDAPQKTILERIHDKSTLSILQMSTMVSMYLNEYNEGELENTENYHLDSKLYTIPNNEDIDISIFEKFKSYIENDLSLKFNENYLLETVEAYENANTFIYSGLTDSEGVYATESEVENWKSGDEELYSKDCSISTYINGNEIDSKLLYDILKSGLDKYKEKIKDETEKSYTVWVGGTEVNDNLLTKKEAKSLAKKYIDDGYTDVEYEKVESKEEHKKTSLKKQR